MTVNIKVATKKIKVKRKLKIDVDAMCCCPDPDCFIHGKPQLTVYHGEGAEKELLRLMIDEIKHDQNTLLQKLR